MTRRFLSLWAGAAALFMSVPAAAHCDGLDGPVVTAARAALASGKADPVLIWVQPTDEAEIRTAFQQALAVRKHGGAARDLADRYFFETLVRVHRAGEGAPYTGLKPAGRDLGPAIPLADRALDAGSNQEIAALLTGEVSASLRHKFDDVHRKRTFDPTDLAAGREYVESYVAYIHFVEAIHEAATAASGGHYPDGDQAIKASEAPHRADVHY